MNILIVQEISALVNFYSKNSLNQETQNNTDYLKKIEASPEYPNVFPISLPGGKFYIDSTPEKENILIRHVSGSFICFEPNGDVFVNSPRDLKFVSEKNTVLRVGENIDGKNSDKLVIQVIGDAHLKVENDLHVEVNGNKYETINKDYKIDVRGLYTVSANSMNLGVSGKYTEKIYDKEMSNTFTTNNIGVPDESGVGGEIRDIIYGNRIFELKDPRSTFQVITPGNISFIAGSKIPEGDTSPGTICFNSTGTQTQTTKKDLIRQITGNYDSIVSGNYNETVEGDVEYQVSGKFDINVDGVFKIDAALIYLN